MALINSKIVVLALLLLACSEQEDIAEPVVLERQVDFEELSYLALGDSYTVGESVATSSSFPTQLEKSLEDDLNTTIQTKIVAKTGWRTDNLLGAIDTADLNNETFDFITLLIGVNNQYQGLPFSKYEEEFPQLLAVSLKLADNDSNRVVVVSIPDWGFTPFGQNRDRQKISTEIDAYNAFAKSNAEASGIRFIEITDITREGLDRPELVADDGLHPSGEAYKLFVDRIAPIISDGLKD